MDASSFFARLDAVDELTVRESLAAGRYNEQHAKLAHEWLRRKEEERVSASAAKRDAREEEALSIARDSAASARASAASASDSAASARSQSRWAMWAAVIATIAAVIAIKDQIIALIF